MHRYPYGSVALFLIELPISPYNIIRVILHNIVLIKLCVCMNDQWDRFAIARGNSTEIRIRVSAKSKYVMYLILINIGSHSSL